MTISKEKLTDTLNRKRVHAEKTLNNAIESENEIMEARMRDRINLLSILSVGINTGDFDEEVYTSEEAEALGVTYIDR